MINELADRIWNRIEFKDDYKMLVMNSMQVYQGLGKDVTPLSLNGIKKLLQSAATFAATDNPKYREVANRIAILTWLSYKSEYQNLNELVTFILGRMGNFPAVSLLQTQIKKDEESISRYIVNQMSVLIGDANKKKEYFESEFEDDGNFVKNHSINRLNEQKPTMKNVEINTRYTFPIRLEIENSSHEYLNTVEINHGETIVLTDFQYKLWSNLSSGRSVTVSAPTSAGKSYALQRFLAKFANAKDSLLAVYIVPTRALINQVSLSLFELLSKYPEKSVSVINIPLAPSNLENKKVIYVLTQERLHYLIAEFPNINFDLIIVDESQTIAADEKSQNSRGILLQSVIEKVLNLENLKVPQIMFAAPLTENPEVFPSTFDLNEVIPINEEESPVPQNLFLLDFNTSKSNYVNVSYRFNEEEIKLGTKFTNVNKTILRTDYLTLATLAWEFGRLEKSIVYANDASKCEKIAEKLTNWMLISENQNNLNTCDLALDEFSDFIKEHVHPQYQLADAIKHRIAFHYGDMPAIIKKTIEELYDEGKIIYLVCTSTLLHGVNLPAKNLFLLKPTKGSKPLSSIEFWNLAGRAGRMGRDFNGNIYLINTSEWQDNPLKGQKKQNVQPSYYYYLTEKKKELIEYIENENHVSGQRDNQGLENAFVKFFNDFRKGTVDTTFKKLKDKISTQEKDQLITLIQKVNNKIDLPSDILEKNISISPYRQQLMFDFIDTRIASGDMSIIPKHPSSEWKVVHPNFEAIIKIIHEQFQGITNNSHKYFAPLALLWIRGRSLADIINNSYRYKTDHAIKEGKKPPKINSVIREVMSNIEDEVRFRYVKYMSCYIELLKEALRRRNKEVFVEKVPPIPLFLELGASSDTMINLISFGLSRTTSSVIAQLAPSNSLSRNDTIDWVRKLDVENLQISNICKKELSIILQV